MTTAPRSHCHVPTAPPLPLSRDPLRQSCSIVAFHLTAIVAGYWTRIVARLEFYWRFFPKPYPCILCYSEKPKKSFSYKLARKCGNYIPVPSYNIPFLLRPNGAFQSLPCKPHKSSLPLFQTHIHSLNFSRPPPSPPLANACFTKINSNILSLINLKICSMFVSVTSLAVRIKYCLQVYFPSPTPHAATILPQEAFVETLQPLLYCPANIFRVNSLSECTVVNIELNTISAYHSMPPGPSFDLNLPLHPSCALLTKVKFNIHTYNCYQIITNGFLFTIV